MVSAITILFLRCEFLKPTISVSPSRVVVLGGSVTIRCEGRQRSMKFFLRKAGHPNLQVQSVLDGTVAEFPIASVSREDGGSYTCDYRSITDQSRWSYPSDPVEIIVAEPSYPKPNSTLTDACSIPAGVSDLTQPGAAPATTQLCRAVPDYTRGNIVRLALGAGVLLALVLILAEAAHGWRRGGH
nr:leukocyte immunoglobulin-like receptor subfamily A member 2 [Chrysemys picta bellii]